MVTEAEAAALREAALDLRAALGQLSEQATRRGLIPYYTRIARQTLAQTAWLVAPLGGLANRCGAPALHGPCVLDAGHNVGRADVLSNHASFIPREI